MGSDGRMENRLTPDWGDAKHVILYGCGNVARACLGKIQKDFSVDYIIDQMGEMARSWNGCKLLAPKQGLKQRTRQKIIVMTGGRVYQEIAFSLQMAGLKEYEDFCSIEYFFTCWYWTFREENVVMELHMALTMRCTLRCANCNMFVPYYERPVTFTLRQLEEEIELLFQFVDYLLTLHTCKTSQRHIGDMVSLNIRKTKFSAKSFLSLRNILGGFHNFNNLVDIVKSNYKSL